MGFDALEPAAPVRSLSSVARPPQTLIPASPARTLRCKPMTIAAGEPAARNGQRNGSPCTGAPRWRPPGPMSRGCESIGARTGR
jgi:hypothetical protein